MLNKGDLHHMGSGRSEGQSSLLRDLAGADIRHIRMPCRGIVLH